MKRKKGEIKRAVYQILHTEPYARENDGYLIMRVVQILEPDLSGTAFTNIMSNMQYKGISCESITRARRHFFKLFPELKVDKAERARRRKEQEYFLEYGNHIPHID